MFPFARLQPTPASIRADLVSVGFLSLPFLFLAYATTQAPVESSRLFDVRLHGALVWSTAAAGVVLGLVALRGHLRTGDGLTLALAWGLVAHAAVALWSGVFNDALPPFRFLVYGAAANVLFGLALLAFPGEGTYAARARRRNAAMVVASAVVLLAGAYVLGGALAEMGTSASARASQALRASLEFASAFLAATAAIALLLKQGAPTRRGSILLFIGVGYFIQRAIFAILGEPWTLVWWGAEVLELVSMALVAWSVLVVHQDAQRTVEIERLLEYDRMKTRLINTAAHELGTPLTPIKVQIHMLRSQMLGDLNERQVRSLDVLDRNVTQLCSLVDDILDAARLQANRLKVNKEPTDVARLAREAVEAFRAPAQGRGVELTLEGPAAVPAEADPKRVTQVLFNLLHNALKFTPRGGHVRVRVDVEDGLALVRVEDDGDGVPAEDVAKLFQPFSQVHDTERSRHGGSGLGLFICRGIVEQHGGRIWCESGDGKGARFAFTLPAAAVAEAHAAPPTGRGLRA